MIKLFIKNRKGGRRTNNFVDPIVSLKEKSKELETVMFKGWKVRTFIKNDKK